jgi:feruloyl esterase
MLIVRRFVSALSAAGLVVAGACTSSAVKSDDSCDALTGLSLIDLFIESAEWTASDETTPAHCKVTGVIETEINFELLLPDSSSWNGRFLMGGGGGYVGTVQNQAIGLFDEGGTPLQRGYATVGTDTGHEGSGIQAGWALEHQTRQLNWGHRAVHVTAEAAKSIIQQYYGRPPMYSYFVGCSRGGGQAMMESQRYPADFDGIVAAAPAYNWTAFTAGFVQIQQAMFPDGDLDRPVLTPESLSLLATSILTACDADDGVVDGFMTDPRRCDFSPAELPRCVGDKPAADCVTETQLTAIEAVYKGPVSGEDPFFFGFNYGGENDEGGWDSWVVESTRQRLRDIPNAQYGFGTEFYKYFVFGDPNWDYKNYDFSTWQEDTADISRVVDATETDLSEFRNRGGKIIYWTGWSDLALTPLGTIDYYEQLEAGDPTVRDYAKLYMLPGVLHCAGGPGPDKVDWVEAIQAWVEEGRAPERLLASKRDSAGTVTLTRPVCPYPQEAVYDGVGDPSLQSSFRCGRP